MSKWKPCSVAGCLRRAKMHGLCDAHRHRLERTGSLKADRPVLMMNHRPTWGALSQILKGTRKRGG